MTIQEILITLIAAIISGVLATVVTLHINYKQQIIKQKRDLISDIFGYRYQWSGNYSRNDKSGIANAINRIPIVFSGCDDAINAYNDFVETKINKLDNNVANDKLITLLKALCKDAEIQCEKWNDSIIERVLY